MVLEGTIISKKMILLAFRRFNPIHSKEIVMNRVTNKIKKNDLDKVYANNIIYKT